YPADEDGYPLYVFNSPANDRQVVTKIDPVNDDTMNVRELSPQQGGRPEGAFITNEYDRLSWVFLGVASNSAENGSDRIDIYQLSQRSDWIAVNPLEGEVEPDLQFLVTIELNSQGLSPDTYRCELHFTHNAVGREAVVLVEMEVQDPRRAPEDANPLPQNFQFLSPYPNPFNRSLHVSYQLPLTNQVRIGLFDQSGRLVANLFEGEVSGGVHEASWQWVNLPAGLYLIKFEAGGFQATRKVVYMP
ncbi:MAG: T9SS type A sorting domain-containing protein, partial [Calditrichota bacterium]